MKPITWDLEAMRDLMGGPSKNSIQSIYGVSQCGKTTLIIQLMYEISDKTGKPVLVYDTEGGVQQFIDDWDKIHREKYPKAKIEVFVKRDIMKILQDHGSHMVMATSGDDRKSVEAKEKTSGKLKLRLVNKAITSPIAKRVNDKGYAAIFYDSFTMPFGVFGPNQENFPARAHAQSVWLGEMINLIDDYGTSIFVSHHSTKNPTDKYAREQMSGGKAVQYYSKVILTVFRHTAKGIEDYRSLRLIRYFNKAPHKHETVIRLTDNGYIDVKKDELDNARDRKKAPN